MSAAGNRALCGGVARLCVALLLAGALLATIGHPDRVQARPFFTGLTNIGSNEQLAFERTRNAGAKFVRIPLNWADVAPAKPDGSPADPPRPEYLWQPDNPLDPAYRWHDVDVAVIRAAQAGLVPVLQVDSAPRWAQRCVTPPVIPDAICDPDPAALAAFATAAARRYSGAIAGLPRVQYWQALNEPNLSLFFFPQFNTGSQALSPGLYRTLLNSFYAAVKAVDPSNLVLTAGLGPVEVPKWTIGPMRFARDLLCMKGRDRPRPAKGNCGGGVYFDIFAIQPYTTGGPTHQGHANDVPVGDLAKLQALIAAADRAGRIKGRYRHTPLWVTEFSWDSQPPDPGGLPMPILTEWTSEALYEAWSAGVSNFFWYSLRDGKHEPGQTYGQTLESGLYFRGGPDVAQDQPKDVLYAFRFPFVAFARRDGLFIWGRTPNSAPGKVKIQVMKEDGWRTATTVGASKSGVFLKATKSRYGGDRRGFARAVYGGETSLPFPMKRVGSFRHSPFG
ncbi:MAG TPA: hypothetical protein VHQ43_00150 [Solirubrobacterales bacterium]|nr:hypothetical protein [Solirubrobacterales bacterium]